MSMTPALSAWSTLAARPRQSGLRAPRHWCECRRRRSRRLSVVISISTSRTSGDAQDTSGPKLAQLAQAMGADVAAGELLPDDRELAEQRLRHWADVERCELILTTGGTGFAPSDVTPEASRAV